MKILRIRFQLACCFVTLAAHRPLQAAVNNWIGASGNWGTSNNWSLGTPPTSGDTVNITNNGPTVSINASTPTNTLTVNSLNVSAGFSKVDISATTNSVPLRVVNGLTVGKNGIVQLNSNGVLQVDGTFMLSSPPSVAIPVPNFQMNGGTATLNNVIISPASQDGALFSQLAGTCKFLGPTLVGLAPNSTGTVAIVSGTLIATNGDLQLGMGGRGVLNLSGSGPPPTLMASTILLGNSTGTRGVMNVTNGFVNVSGSIQVGSLGSGGTGSLFISPVSTVTVTNASHSAYVLVANGLTSTVTINGTLRTDAMLGRYQTQGGGQLIINRSTQVENGSSVSVTNNNVVQFAANLTAGALTNSTGTVVFDTGSTVSIPDSVLGLGNDGTPTNGLGLGVATVSNATLQAASLVMGSTIGGRGDLTVANNAAVTISSNITMVSSSLAATSTITMSGGTFTATNGTTLLGTNGNARINQSAGTVNVKKLKLGSNGGGGTGSFILSGGTLRAMPAVDPDDGISVNFILVSGGDLDGSGTTVIIGEGHNATMQVDSGSSRAGKMFVGYTPGYTGTLIQNGGVVNVFTNMVLGDCDGGAVGNVALNGGTMYVTNTAHTATLNLRSGTFTLNSGATLVVDTLVITNACAQIIKNGGTLIENNPRVLAANLDADGDGVSNAREIAAGTDPLNAASTFKVTGLVRTNGSDIRVDWTTVGGKSYVVQTNGSLVGAFNDLSPVIAVPGTSESATNYVHTNGAAAGSRFYRVRLGP